MTFSARLLASSILTASLIGAAFAADDDKKDKWDVNNPPGAKTRISIDVEEGTWMSLDVSPDGRTIAFDLLGDIYTMPASGGTATNISSGLAWEYQPRFSPDGQRIAFTSDRAGGDNIWTMSVDGTDKQQVTKESFRLTNNPTWSPDGQFIAAKKHFTTSRSLGTGEIWLYHTSGGSGVQLVKKPSEAHQKELGEPVFSHDGKSIYYTQNITPGSTFIYAQNSHTQLFQIKRYDMDTGDISTAAGGAGGAVRPAPSPDGKYLAFVKRVDGESMLFLKDLKSGHEREIFDHLDMDMQETWAVQGVYPNMDWAPDGSAIFFWAKGKIHKYTLANDTVDHIDFRVRDTRQIMKAPRPKLSVTQDSFQTHMPRFVQVSPSGQQIVYETLGKLFTRPVAGGSPKRITALPENVRELDAAWSRDGSLLVFTTWSDKDLGAIHTVNADGSNLQTLTSEPGHYRRPVFSPSGGFITYEKGSGGGLTAPEWSNETGLYVMSTVGNRAHERIRNSGSGPHFGADDERVYFSGTHDKSAALMSTDRRGKDERVHASSKLAQSFHISPNGKTVAFRENYNLFVMPALSGPQNVAAGPKGNALPVKKVSTNGATYPAWSNNGQTLTWSLGPNLYSASVADAMKDGTDAAKSIGKIRHSHKADKPSGRVTFVNARIITMKGKDGGVIENGTLVVNNDRIEYVGTRASGESGTVIDLAGKTVIPGFIDAHAHGPQGVDGLTPEQNWSAIGHLALGVTTIFDPSSSAENIFPASEFQRTGKLLAPRIFSTGEVIYGAKAPGFFADIGNAADAKEHVTRLQEQGAHGVKNYNQPRREQRQQVTHAARELDLLVVPEGGSLYHMDMSLVADGNSSIEHNIPVSAIYDDVVQMYSQTDVAYVPTLAVTYGGVRGEDYYYQESDVWTHPILSKHVPPTVLKARAKRRQMAPEADYKDDDSGAISKKLMEAGVLVNIGAHGQREGMAAHWEVWSFSRGGMSPVQALKTATINPATHLGFEKDIGSIEEGKLADLIILDANPLEDIRNTDNIDKVMLGGRLYDAKTMNETATGTSTRAAYWWED